MPILYITRKFPPSIGGMQTQSYEFYSALRKRTKVYLIAWGKPQKYLPIFLLQALFKSIYYNLKYNIDVIQVGDLLLSPLGLFLKRVFHKRILAMAHGKDTSFNNLLYTQIVFRSAKNVDGIVCVSNFLREKLLLKGILPDKLFVNPNGIDCSMYDKLLDKAHSITRIESKYKITLKRKKILLSVSRLVRKKGIANFVRYIFPEIVRNCPHTLFLIVGQEYSREAMKEKSDIIDAAESLGLNNNIFFVGNVHDRDGLLRQIYRASDVFVMPNQHIKEDFEGFGIAALEASLNELPVVAFAVDGIRDAVKDGQNGILLRRDDNEGFAKEVTRLLRHDKKRKSLGQNARRFVKENYNWDMIINKYCEILRLTAFELTSDY